MLEPGLAIPAPARHVVHALHAARPASAVNVPPAHAAQTRSLVGVAAVAVNLPGEQGGLTGLHMAPPTAAEYVRPALQGPHVRSAVDDPDCCCPEPAKHVAHAAHAVCPATALNMPSAQSTQARSLVAVGTVVIYLPLAHGGLTSVHAPPLISGE